MDSMNSDDKKHNKIYDLSVSLKEEIIVYPGDPVFKSEILLSLKEGHDYNLSYLHLCNHIGTHIDYPSHIINNGKTSSDYPIEYLLGAAVIINVSSQESFISKEFIAKQNILPGDIVFFRTNNSKFSKYDKLMDEYVYVDHEAVQEILKKRPKIVGIDYISIDSPQANLAVHKTLLSNDILIIEGLELNNVPEGRCEVFIMPLKLDKADGAPVRVIAKF
jgi:arylformamidase